MAMAKKHCRVPFCPPSHAKNPDLSFFRIPKEKCRQDSWLRAIGRYVDKEKENGEKTPWQPIDNPGTFIFLPCIFLQVNSFFKAFSFYSSKTTTYCLILAGFGIPNDVRPQHYRIFEKIVNNNKQQGVFLPTLTTRQFMHEGRNIRFSQRVHKQQDVSLSKQ